MTKKDYVVLNNGMKIPKIGLGLWQIKGQSAIDSVSFALNNGYSLIDTASAYFNEEEVGLGIKKAKVDRDQILISTKLWNDNQGYEATLEAFNRSLDKLQLDYIDLYLMHWPVEQLFSESWRAMEKLYSEKRVRAIGVCNFNEKQLLTLLNTATIKPMINQIELHPLMSQAQIRKFCENNDIQIEAWSPLGHGRYLYNNSLLNKIAKKHKKTVAQVILRWEIQLNTVAIPKYIHENRIKENINIYDFGLAEEEIETINRLNQNLRLGPSPENFAQYFSEWRRKNEGNYSKRNE